MEIQASSCRLDVEAEVVRQVPDADEPMVEKNLAYTREASVENEVAWSPFLDLPHCSFHQTSATETSPDQAQRLESAECPLSVAGHRTKPGEHLMKVLAASHPEAACYLTLVLCLLEPPEVGEYQSTVAYPISAV
jgi:hypothetical protein